MVARNGDLHLRGRHGSKSLEGTSNHARQDSNAFPATEWFLVAILGGMDEVPAGSSDLAIGAWRVDLVGEGMARRLERWAAEARVDEAARRRLRGQWLRRQLQEEATLHGVLVDLAERGESVAVQLATGAGRHGRLVLVGRDLAGLALRDGSLVLLALHAIATVRTGPGVAPTVGEPRHPGGLGLAAVLSDLAADRHPVTFGVLHAGGGSGGGAQVVAGTLQWVGDDVAVVQGAGEGRVTSYVPLDAIAEVLLR